MAGKKPLVRVKAGTSKESAEDKKLAFVEAYLSNGGNASEAAIAAGYSKSGAGKQGYRMSKDPQIMSMLDMRRKDICTKLEISTDRVLKERARLAFFDPRKLFNASGQPIPIHELDDDTAAALAGLDVLEEFEGTGDARTFVGYTKKYKLADKNASLTALEKHLGMYEKDNQQKTSALDGLPRELLQAMVQRLKALNGQR